MLKQNFILGMAVLFSSKMAYSSVIDICDLAAKEVSGSTITSSLSSFEISNYKSKLANECELSKKFKSLNDKLSNNKIRLTDITEYQALRMVDRGWYNRAQEINKPVEIIYQLKEELYDKPFPEQNTDTWDNWAFGIRQLEPTIQIFKDGNKFDINSLKKIHKGLFPFYPMINEISKRSYEPNPGVLKETASDVNDNYWWSLDSQDKIDHAVSVVQIENETYSKLGLLTSSPNGFPSFVGKIVDVRLAKNRDSGPENIMAVYSGSSMVNRQNTELILDMVDKLMKQARQGLHMVWRNKLFTPAELAYFVQQAYVRVHPFTEGNGRTSRFLQELILLSFQLPHGSSGDLMETDALSESSEYYRSALDANFALLNKMDACATEIQRKAGDQDARQIDQAKLSYGCRILSNRTNIWNKLKNDNEVTNQDKFKQANLKLESLDAQSECNHQTILAHREGKRYKCKSSLNENQEPAQVPLEAINSRQSNMDPYSVCTEKLGADKIRCEADVAINMKLRN